MSQPSSTPTMPKLIDLKELHSDPSDRKRILDYHPNQIDEIRRTYILRGPTRPEGYVYPPKMIGDKSRRFNPKFYEDFDWLEYSVKTDSLFCLPCYLFKDQISRKGGGDAFILEGFSGWNKLHEKLDSHVGEVGSIHRRAVKNCDALMRQNQSIVVALHKQSDITKNEYQIRLNASIDVSRYFLNSALPFRGHDESENSFHREHFLEMMKYTQNQNESVQKVTLKNAPGNNQMVSPKIQKDSCHCFAQEILKSILTEIGDDVFALLVDESSDVSKKEQMAVVLRFVDGTCGLIKERFVGLVHMKETSSLTLKLAIDSLLTELGLSLKKIRGRGYDGASNMREFDDRFNEVNSELLTCMAVLDPRDSFGAFDSLQLVRLVDFYPDDFSSSEKIAIERELEIYIDNVGEDERFAHLNGIGDLARVMVQTKKHLSYPLLYRLLKLALVLPVATATVERCFSTMKLVKSDLRNRIGDEYLSDCLISAIEKESLAKVTNDDVIDRFQKMKTRREQL
ncbi:zinc finger MYM-type protein 1-like [Heracleum sosnowskyi]|uniref:Zinc finger MYM-type protein 1-like n=1 Tax=Heracleum sosnowskyi TaxID=360622 RepID=A0AAD8GVU9_9APIA|nr:zinc finger MYM-type protein 1-like [Heracleum sosnowskyi]